MSLCLLRIELLWLLVSPALLLGGEKLARKSPCQSNQEATQKDGEAWHVCIYICTTKRTREWADWQTPSQASSALRTRINAKLFVVVVVFCHCCFEEGRKEGEKRRKKEVWLLSSLNYNRIWQTQPLISSVGLSWVWKQPAAEWLATVCCVVLVSKEREREGGRKNHGKEGCACRSVAIKGEDNGFLLVEYTMWLIIMEVGWIQTSYIYIRSIRRAWKARASVKARQYYYSRLSTFTNKCIKEGEECIRIESSNKYHFSSTMCTETRHLWHPSLHSASSCTPAL